MKCLCSFVVGVVCPAVCDVEPQTKNRTARGTSSQTPGPQTLALTLWSLGTVVCVTVFGGSNLYLSSKIWDIRQNPFYILSSLSHTHFNLMLLNVSSERNVYSLGINSISFFTIWQLYAWSLQLTHPRRLFFLAKAPKVFLIFWKTVCQE